MVGSLGGFGLKFMGQADIVKVLPGQAFALFVPVAPTIGAEAQMGGDDLLLPKGKLLESVMQCLPPLQPGV